MSNRYEKILRDNPELKFDPEIDVMLRWQELGLRVRPEEVGRYAERRGVFVDAFLRGRIR